MYERPELDREYLTKWIEAEYEVLGWWLPVEKPEGEATIPLTEEK